MSSSSVVFYMLDGHVVEDDDGGHCVLLYGRTKGGRSVTIQVRGFRPFVYMSPDQAQKCTGAVWKTTERRTRAYGYHPMAEPFIKVEFSSMKEYRRQGYKKFMYDRRNIMLLFLYVTKTNMSSWVTVGCVKPLLDSTSTSQDMYTAYIDWVRPLTTNVPRQLPPIMVCSFDIETFSPTGSFPQSCVVDNPIICIGLVFSAYPFDTMRKVVLTTKASTPLDDVEIVVCASESIMLDTFATLTEDTDVFTGYNIVGFDYQYLCDRAMRLGPAMQREFVFKQQKSPEERWRQCRAKYRKAVEEHVNMSKLEAAVRLLGVYETFEVAHAAADGFTQYTPVNTFFQQDRQRRVRCPYVTKYTDTAAKGQSTIHRLQRNGRVDFDLLPYIRNSMKLLNYKLNTVSKEVLGDRKVDLPIPEMFRKWEAGDPESVSVVLNYCVIDCVLPLTLLMKLSGLENQTEMSCVASTNLDDVVNGGQQIKSYNLLRRYCLEHGYIMDDPTIFRPEDLKGATVLPPQSGFYQNPTATLDFASLYPSIMRARNLCYTTLVLDPRIKAKLSPKDTYVVDTGSETFTYVKSHLRKGILPEILGSLLDQRKQAKKDMKNAKDPLEKSVQNGRQLALKVTANSLYGFTGVGKGYFPCYPIAISVTATGRRMIQECKLITQQHYPTSQCVYGDSVVGHTPLLLREKGKKTIVRRIDELASEWVPTADGKECCELSGVESWTASGWTTIHRIIRHRVEKPLVTVNTTTGIVVCTTDHSLLRPNGEEVSPHHLRKGDQLMVSSFPNAVCSRTYTWNVWFVRAYVHRPSSTSFSTLKEAIESSGHAVRRSNEWEWQPQHRRIPLNEDMARLLGMFVGDGSCGSYSCQSGKKKSWALNNANRALLDEYMVCATRLFPDFQWRILDTRGSSHVYKLVPQCSKKGAIVNLVRFFRRLCYEPNGEKRIDDRILNSSMAIREAFWQGLRDADGTKASKYPEISQKGEKICLSIVALLTSIGYPHVTVDARPDKPGIYRMRARKEHRKAAGIIRSITPYDKQELYVYDLTTDNQHFHAGIGNLIVHNTDSIMVQFQGCNNSQEGLERCFEHGERLATIITEYFQKMTETPYIIMEFEKACWPQLFFAVKKRYLSRYYESKDGPAKLDAKGVQLVRTDGSKLLRDVYRDIVNAIIPLDGLPAKDPQQIGGEIEHILTSHLQKMRQRPIEDFVIAKTLKTEYKNGGDNIAQVWLWKQLLKRIDMGEITMQPPRSGDKMPYVIMFNKDKKKKVFEKVEHPEYAEFLNLDFGWYVESLRKPLTQLSELFTSNVPGILDTFLHAEGRRRNNLQDISSFFSSTPLALDRVTTEERPPHQTRQPAPTIKAKHQTGKKKSSISTFFSNIPEPPVQKRKQAPTMTKAKADTNKKSKPIASFFNPCSGV